MKISKNNNVQRLLDEIQTVDGIKYIIICEVRDTILNIYKKAEEKIMYGGIVFFMDEEMFAGLFAYKKHVSLEFSNGHRMKDPDQRLEGKGKYRRHIKLLSKNDIDNLNVAYYVKQAI